MSFFSSVEFYVIASVAAAAVVGLCVRPRERGAAITHLLAGRLGFGETGHAPAIGVAVDDHGKVTLTRYGLDGQIHASGAVSLAVTVAGFDITVEERLTAGRIVEGVEEPVTAQFAIDFLGREHYHLKYYSEALGAMTAATLHVRPGIRFERPLL